MSHTEIDRRGVLRAMAALGFATGTAQAQGSNPLGVPPPLEVYGKLPAVEKVALSPGGKRIAMVMQQGEKRVIADYDIASKAVSVLPVGDTLIWSLFWVDDAYLAIITRSTMLLDVKSTVLSGVVVNIPKGTSVPITGENASTSTFLSPLLNLVTIDGRRELHYYTYDYKGIFYARTLDPATGKRRYVMEDIPVNGFVTTPEGKPVVGVEYKWEHKLWRLKFNIQDNWKTSYEETGRLDTPNLMAGLGRDGVSAVVFMNSGDKAGDYYEVAPDGTFSAPLTTEGSGESSPIFHPKTRRLAGFTTTKSDWVGYDFYDPVMKHLPEAVEVTMAGYRFSFSDFAEDPRKSIIYTEGEDDAGTYFYADLSTGNYTQIGLQRPDLPPQWIAKVKPLDYKAADGLEIHAYLTLPPGREAKNLPLVVLPHGGPEARDDISFNYEAQALASRGYAVLQPNFRGSTDKDKAFVERGYGEWGRKMQTDLSDGIRHLASQGLIDPKRVAIWGSSYGGYAAMAGAAFDAGVYSCAVAVSGISDLKSFVAYEIRSSYSKYSGSTQYWQRQLGDEALWDDYSPARHAARINIPMLLIHGKDDGVVEFSQSQKMYEALKAEGKPVELVTLEGEDHFLSKGPTRLKSLKAAIAFIEKHNPAY